MGKSQNLDLNLDKTLPGLEYIIILILGITMWEFPNYVNVNPKNFLDSESVTVSVLVYFYELVYIYKKKISHHNALLSLSFCHSFLSFSKLTTRLMVHAKVTRNKWAWGGADF